MSCIESWQCFEIVCKINSLQMAEALMLEMDGDSDGSITEQELVKKIKFFRAKKSGDFFL